MDLTEVTITASGSEGQGIGSLPSGKTCFAPGVFPGERCLCEIISETPKYAIAEVKEVIEASPDRTAPFRPSDEVSGGLPFACLSYEAQLKIKSARVRDCLIRIGGYSPSQTDEFLRPVLASEDPKRYRNHMQYAIRNGRIGLLCAKSDELGEYDGELIEYEVFGKIKAALEQVFERAPTRLFDGLVLRGSLRTKEILAELVSSEEGPHEVVIRDAKNYIGSTGLYEAVKNVCDEGGFRLNGLLLRISPDKTSKRTRTGTRTVIEGVDYYDELFCGRKFRIKAGSFFQVNTAQAEKLANKASEACGGANVIYDLYCGCGTLGLAVKKKGQRLLGIEVVPEAVQSVKMNRSLSLDENEASECEFICKDVLKTDFNSLIKAGKILPPDCIIVDPPRKGLDIGVIKKLEELGSPSVCYISCDPATLARDLKMLTRTYKIMEVTPADLFPNASHVETVVLLSKLSSAPKLEVKINTSELDLTEAEAKATYDEIRDYVKETTGLHVPNLYIAQTKRKLGLDLRENFNLPKCENPKKLKCPPEKEKAIIAALKHFKMIS